MLLDTKLGEELNVDSDDEFQYEEVPVDEDFVAPGMNFKVSTAIEFNKRKTN